MNAKVSAKRALMSDGRSQWLLIILLAVGLVALMSLPYWLATTTARPGTFFTGIIMNPEDSQTYFAKMRQGYDGQWLYTIPFTTEAHEPAWVGVFYVWLGQAARALGVSLTAVWHGARSIGVDGEEARMRMRRAQHDELRRPRRDEVAGETAEAAQQAPILPAVAAGRVSEAVSHGGPAATARCGGGSASWHDPSSYGSAWQLCVCLPHRRACPRRIAASTPPRQHAEEACMRRVLGTGLPAQSRDDRSVVDGGGRVRHLAAGRRDMAIARSSLRTSWTRPRRAAQRSSVGAGRSDRIAGPALTPARLCSPMTGPYPVGRRARRADRRGWPATAIGHCLAPRPVKLAKCCAAMWLMEPLPAVLKFHRCGSRRKR